MASEEQKKSNADNAQHSTGPNDTTNSRWNALKHGLCAKQLIIPHESREEFEFVLTQLHECLKPVDTVEEMLVERAAVAYWRLVRAARSENGWIMHNYIPDEPPDRTREVMRMAGRGYSEKDFEILKSIKEKSEQAGVYHKAIPREEHTEHLARYESSAENQFCRAIQELQKYRAWKSQNCGTKPTSE